MSGIFGAYGSSETTEVEIDVVGDYENSYANLTNKPKINGHEVNGDMSLDDLGIKVITDEDKETLDKLRLKNIDELMQYMGDVYVYSQLTAMTTQKFGYVYHVLFDDSTYIWDGTKWAPFFGTNSELDSTGQPDSNVIQNSEIEALFN